MPYAGEQMASISTNSAQRTCRMLKRNELIEQSWTTGSLKRTKQSRPLPISLMATLTRVRKYQIPVSNYTCHGIHQRRWNKYISRDDWVTLAYLPQLPPGGNGSYILRIYMLYEASPSSTYPSLCLQRITTHPAIRCALLGHHLLDGHHICRGSLEYRYWNMYISRFFFVFYSLR